VQLTFDSTAAVLAPVTDGSAVVYARESGTGPGTVQQLIYRGADGGEEELTPPLSGAVFPESRIWTGVPFYATWNGWTAFELPDESGTWHTRVRGPGGE
jgi:hypothetical protein